MGSQLVTPPFKNRTGPKQQKAVTHLRENMCQIYASVSDGAAYYISHFKQKDTLNKFIWLTNENIVTKF